MKVLIDGPDGVGKTSICEKLANKLGCNIIRLTHGGDRSLSAYCESVSIDNMVHDRTFLSEIIYPKYFGRESRVNDVLIHAVSTLISTLEAKVFILTADDDVLIERLSKRGDEFLDDINVIKDIKKDYLRIAQEYGYTVIDTSNKTIDEIVEEMCNEHICK